METGKRLDLVVLWHMHQPDYRDYATGEFRLPWVYLHAIKDYTDMAWHLEHHPGMRAVVNFTPVLLDQIEDYASQFASGRLRDPMLKLLALPEGRPMSAQERAFVLERCFQVNHDRMVQPFAAYKSLHNLHAALQAHVPEAAARYLSDQYFHDLVTWYHLSWTGETVRRSSEIVTRLMSTGACFSAGDRAELLKLIAGLVTGVVERYAKLAAGGRIELSTTPDHHPLAPMLIDFSSARDAQPGVRLPMSPEYPGGRERVTAHLRTAIEAHGQRFGEPPAGVWPAEGAVSSPFLGLVGAQGGQWAASGEQVLMNSLRAAGAQAPVSRNALYRPYRLADAASGPALFFRDDRLSDLIGFEYAKWNSHDAAANFIGELEAIAASSPKGEAPLVSVILDGENCWEYYDYNGYYFLEELYRRLESHAAIRTTTFRACLAEAEANATVLERLAAGSWVHGNFSTWIGSEEKNRAWDLLCAAKQSFDLVVASGRLDEAQTLAARRQLTACEASDWFWWLGPNNPREAVATFDELFRSNLENLYRILSLPAPANLAHPISHGHGHPEAGGTMRRAGESMPGG